MRKDCRTIITAHFLFIVLTAWPQEYSHEFAKPTKYELEMQEYTNDNLAEAIVIYDIGKTRFNRTDVGFIIVFERRIKIKILSEAGLKNSEIAILVYRDNETYERIEKIEGFTYNLENGLKQVLALDPKQVYEEKVGENWYNIKFAMPAVKPGSIIEYRYTLETPRIFYLRDWDFQCKIPTLYSEYEIRMIPFYQYTWLLQGASKFDSYTVHEDDGLPQQYRAMEYRDNVITYVMKNVPAFRDEEFITSIEDYLIKIDFQLSTWIDYYGAKTDVITTWPALCKELLNDTDFGKYMKASSKQSAKNFNYNLLTGLSDDEKFKTVIEYVKSNYNWNGYKGYMASKSVGKFLAEKTGSIANINLFLCGMLQEAGLEAHPVLISTRDHGKIKQDLPFLSFFNHVIVVVTIDGKRQLADATDSFCPDMLVPEMCLNDLGLIVQKDLVEWAVLTSSMQSVLKKTFFTEIPANSDSLLVDFRVSATNYEAMWLRKKYSNKYDNLEEYILDKNLAPVDSISVRNYLESNEDFLISCKAMYATERINNKIYFSPFYDEPMNKNLFTQAKRNYPIDMEYPKTYLFYSILQIPDGYKLEYVPKNLINDGKLASVRYLVENPDSNTLSISGSYTFHKAVYEATDYANLKFYCNEIINKFNEKVVLIKNE